MNSCFLSIDYESPLHIFANTWNCQTFKLFLICRMSGFNLHFPDASSYISWPFKVAYSYTLSFLKFSFFIFSFSLIYKSTLFIQETNQLSVLCFVNVFSQFGVCLFTVYIVYLHLELFYFNVVILSIFYCVVCGFVCRKDTKGPYPKVIKILPYVFF